MQLSFKTNSKTSTIASSSFLVSHLIPAAVTKFTKKQFNIIELPPEDFITVGLRSGFNICVHTQKLDWPNTWTSVEAGQIHYNLYARKEHSIFKEDKVTKFHLESSTFVTPAYWTREGVKTGDDQFPKKIKRISWHKTSTALSAAIIISISDHLGFLPSLVSKQFSNLKKIETDLLEKVSRPVFITVKSEEVSNQFYQTFISEVKSKLNA